MKKYRRSKPYKSLVIVTRGGPFNGGKISMGLDQLDTLVFSVSGCPPGQYHRTNPACLSAFWQPEPTTILRKGATCGAKL